MLQTSLAPYLLWAKTRRPAPIDLAGSNLLHCDMDDLPGAREALALSAPNDNGYPPVLTAIAGHYGVTPDRVVQAGGCSGANFITVAALVGAGDDVLIERPTYDPLIGAARLMGANVVRFERRAANGFRLDLDDVRRAMTPNTRLIIVTTPHNPSGVQIDRTTLEGLAAMAAAAGAHVLVDEVYLDAACLVAGARETSRSAAQVAGPVVVTSSLTVMRPGRIAVGWAVAPPETAERLRRTRDVVDNANSAPADRLARWPGRCDRLWPRAARCGRNVALAREFFLAHPRSSCPSRRPVRLFLHEFPAGRLGGVRAGPAGAPRRRGRARPVLRGPA
jgi:histidinol-phosphate/aromatic aminotransferase/cobyric acid decarboxylase-like protein